MIKIIAFVIFTISCLRTAAQADSIKNNLERHKQLYEQGLISKQEYELLKKKELNLLDVPETKKEKPITPQQYKGKIIIGSIALTAGISMITSGFLLKDKTEIVQGNYTGAPPRVVEYKTQARVLFIAGTLFSGLGIAIMAKGARLRSKYIDAQIKGNSVSLRVNF